MIEKAVIEDFQALKKLEVEFSPTNTTIVGPNDKGKTAMLRAVLLLCLNSHRSPNRFIRVSKSGFKITLYVDGHKIVRKKSKSGNVYFLDGKKFKFDSTRIRVPEPIAHLLNVSRENFQLQHDRHFWFSETPGQISKKINELVGLSSIDSTLSNINKDVREAERDVEITKRELEDARGLADRLAWVPRFRKRLASLEATGRKLESASSVAQELRSALQEYSDTMKRGKRLRIAYRAIKRVEQIGTKAERQARKVKQLGKLLKEWKRARRDSMLRVPDLTRLERLRKKADDYSNLVDDLFFDLKDLQKGRDNVKELDAQLRKLERQLRKAERKAKLCPTCGRPLKGRKHKHKSSR